MPVYEFLVTRNITESAVARVKAKSIADAHAKAMKPGFAEKNNLKFENDDNEPDEIYIPDSEDYSISP